MRHRKLTFKLLALVFLAVFAGETEAQILSSKRGFADVGANYGNLQATGAGWYYTWGTGTGNPGNFDAQHIPMIWGGTPSQTTINNIKNRPEIEWVLGFNEPERDDQANMSVSQAISSWTTMTNGFSGSDIKLVSPAVADTGDGQAWLSNFMNQASNAGLPVDAVAFHWYGVSNPDNPAGAASSFLSRVASYNSQYNKPVFITEFAIHDWGGNYSDEVIIEANRQFLNIAIPELEARDYVAGYAWYHWFSDANLYQSNTPTPMAYSYVGALQNGDVEDVGNQNYGEHVAYLTGGELTRGTGSSGSLKYINALENVSTISGEADWNLTSGNWVRIQSNATLRKTGSNVMTINGATIINNGVLDVASGTLRLGSSMQGTGNLRVSGGTLALTGFSNVSQASKIDVRSGGMFDVTGLVDTYVVFNDQQLSLAKNATVTGSVIANPGSSITSAGTFANSLTVRSGAVVRVGKASIGSPSRYLVDNFESYEIGNVRDVADPPWTAHQSTSLVDIENLSGNQVLSYGWASNFRGTSRELPEESVIGNDSLATFFFRVNAETDAPNHNFGLGDEVNTSGVDFGNYEAQVRFKPGSLGTFDIDARDGGNFTSTLASGLQLNTWHNFWLVIDQEADTYDIYMNNGNADATLSDKLNASPLDFRNGTSADLNQILALAGSAPIDNGIRIDDIYYFTGSDLFNPLGVFDPGLNLVPDLLIISGDFIQESGSILELDIYDGTILDQVNVGGVFSAAGTLRLSLDSNAPAPQLGDTFSLFSFSSVNGEFDSYLFPELSNGLAWNVSNLTVTGILEVVTDVDMNDNGLVDGQDFMLIQRTNPSLISDWQALYGSHLVTPSGLSTTKVPEPSSWLLLTFSAFVAFVIGLSRRGEKICKQ